MSLLIYPYKKSTINQQFLFETKPRRPFSSNVPTNHNPVESLRGKAMSEARKQAVHAAVVEVAEQADRGTLEHGLMGNFLRAMAPVRDTSQALVAVGGGQEGVPSLRDVGHALVKLYEEAGKFEQYVTGTQAPPEIKNQRQVLLTAWGKLDGLDAQLRMTPPIGVIHQRWRDYCRALMGLRAYLNDLLLKMNYQRLKNRPGVIGDLRNFDLPERFVPEVESEAVAAVAPASTPRLGSATEVPSPGRSRTAEINVTGRGWFFKGGRRPKDEQ